jgi:hypothetical protein
VDINIDRECERVCRPIAWESGNLIQAIARRRGQVLYCVQWWTSVLVICNLWGLIGNFKLV